MFNRLSVVKGVFSRNVINVAVKATSILGLTFGFLFNGMAVANETAANETAANKTTNEVKVTAVANEKQQGGDKKASVVVENNKIVFAKVGPNEQVISMSTLEGYRNLHQNLRRRSISLNERRRASVSSADDSQVSK